MKKDKIKSKFNMKVSRRQVLKAGLYGGAAMMFPLRFGISEADAVRLIPQLSDPANQPKFVNTVPNALDPGFMYTPVGGEYTVGVGPTTQWTGLMSSNGRNPVMTPLLGYGQGGAYTWPGKTFQIQSGPSNTIVNWENNLFGITEHPLRVDKSLHWCYSLPGYEQYTIENAGIPIITHLHGGNTDFQYDGNPEFFYTPGAAVVGPQWANVSGGFTNRFVYNDDVPAGNLWYHDHALGLTRLNVYAGMAGFYFVRDAFDTGQPGNPADLPAFPYEMALAIQDRMFKRGGELFYPGLPGDPFWDDFITGEGLSNGDVPKPSALAEFFGDHMVVNGLIWPKADVEPRYYRMHLLNGCDSRFMAIRFRKAATPNSTNLDGADSPLPFYVIGSDQGLAASPTEVITLLSEPGGRYDIIFDFAQAGINEGDRIIMENFGADAPFGGPLAPEEPEEEDLFHNRQTDRIMAFDVTKSFGTDDPGNIHPNNFNPVTWTGPYTSDPSTAGLPVRKVALFEGLDEYGRLQPLLGVAEPTEDAALNIVNGTIPWHSPTTELPYNNSTEIWEIYNATGDAHPIHLHLVNFEILDRQEYNATVIEQPVLQHNGTFGTGFRLENITLVGGSRETAPPVDKAPKDMVNALPTQTDPPNTGQVTRIKVTFDKVGRYVWHCHILSHEDHEMMRVLQVLPAPA